MVVGLDRKLRPIVEAMIEDYAASKGSERVALVNSAVEQLTALAKKESIFTPFTHKVASTLSLSHVQLTICILDC